MGFFVLLNIMSLPSRISRGQSRSLPAEASCSYMYNGQTSNPFHSDWEYIYLFIYFFNFLFIIYLLLLLFFLFLAVLGLRFCVRAFSSYGEWGPLFIAVRGPLTIAASLAAEQRPQTLRLSSCGSRAQLLRGMWDLPRPGLEPVSPALAGRFSTTAPPGKPGNIFILTFA